MRRVLVSGSDHQVGVDGQLIGKHELATNDLYASAKRRATRRVADREKQVTAGFEEILERITRLGQARCRSPTRTATARPTSLASSTHDGQI